MWICISATKVWMTMSVNKDFVFQDDALYVWGRCLYKHAVMSAFSLLLDVEPDTHRCIETHLHALRRFSKAWPHCWEHIIKDNHSLVGQAFWHEQWVRSYHRILRPCVFVISWMPRPIWCDTAAEPLTMFIVLRPTRWLSPGEQLLHSHAVIVPFHLAAPLTSYPLCSNHTGIL